MFWRHYGRTYEFVLEAHSDWARMRPQLTRDIKLFDVGFTYFVHSLTRWRTSVYLTLLNFHFRVAIRRQGPFSALRNLTDSLNQQGYAAEPAAIGPGHKG